MVVVVAAAAAAGGGSLIKHLRAAVIYKVKIYADPLDFVGHSVANHPPCGAETKGSGKIPPLPKGRLY